MPIIATVANPYTEGEFETAWIYCRVASFDFEAKTGRLVYEAYADRDSAYGGKPPVRTLEIILGSPAQYGYAVLVSPGEPAVYEQVTIREPGTNGPDDPGEVETVLVSPAVDPVYGEPPLIRPAIPSLEELIANNQAAYAALQQVADQLALTLPEFADAAIES